jgi:hypothetical protein
MKNTAAGPQIGGARDITFVSVGVSVHFRFPIVMARRGARASPVMPGIDNSTTETNGA